MSMDMPSPKEICDRALEDLLPHKDEFDAVVVVSDAHAITFGAVVAAALDKPMLIICTKPHEQFVSQIVPVGVFHPRMRVLYVDDWFEFGASLRHALEYMFQSKAPNLVATYEAVEREYKQFSMLDYPEVFGNVRGLI